MLNDDSKNPIEYEKEKKKKKEKRERKGIFSFLNCDFHKI